ncbi:MAG: DUF4435 domain-containing protein [Muribaculaceae bacterium]|nr:DUF4435 domain-containing protein [Muribaculaceae bacterium]
MSSKRSDLPLPMALGGEKPSLQHTTRRVTIIGANGAGKSRFMDEMIRLCGNRAYVLSALSASFPEQEVSEIPGSVDDLYRRATERMQYMRPDALSQLDKLSYMLFADELESMLDFKERLEAGKAPRHPSPTPLDKVKDLWKEVFPGSAITRHKGTLMFATRAGNDLVTLNRLSQGEKTVLYYASAVLYAMPQAVVFIDSPSMFLHPSITGSFWNAIERLRPDCTFVYNSVDVDFVQSHSANTCIWIKRFDSAEQAWDYQVMQETPLTEELFLELAGSRRPVMFIEGDSRHSIDSKLYSLVFTDWTVRPLGSCNKVIETTRTFNDLKYMHQLRSRGIVDRDRRTDQEVEYLRRKEILVPDVAEVENIFLLPGVIHVMARRRAKSPSKVMDKVKTEVLRMFRQQADTQALQHVRHRVKREVECKIDARFTCITALETHLKTLVFKLQPRKHYNALRKEFSRMIEEKDYDGVLKVFNHKPMLTNCGIHQMLGYRSKEDYISGVLEALGDKNKDADQLRATIRHCFRVDNEGAPAGQHSK